MKHLTNKIMKKILILLISLTLISCTNEKTLLNKTEYKVIDTIHISTNSYGDKLGYYVIIEIDSLYYAGKLNYDKDLVFVNPRRLKLKNK
jgi:hypothetical protein